MAAIMHKRKKHGSPRAIVNRYVEDGDKRYRVVFEGSHPVLVALKCGEKGERLLAYRGRRFWQIVLLARERYLPAVAEAVREAKEVERT